MKKPHYLIGIVLLVIFAGFSYSTFRDTLTPYVSYDEARAKGHTVQVAGGLEQGTSAYDDDADYLRFTLVDEEHGDTLRVRYNGLKPANFADAISIVAIGTFDPAADEFAADKLLVKCPSKYQGIEGVEEKTYS